MNFHKEWSKNKIIDDDVQTFTVREIAAVMKALGDGRDPFETMLIIYGARYLKEKKEKMITILRKKNSYFENLPYPKWEIPKNFPNCYPSSSLCEAVSSILFSFENGRHVIISGLPGSGKTKLARWISKYYENININKMKNVYHSNESYFCICTEEIKPSDLIGKLKPADKATIEEGGEILSWKDGILTEAITNGNVLILDCIEQAPSTVTERLNGLLDKKYDGKDKFFEIPENPKTKGKGIKINENFRLLCTCNIEKINSMSPAFVNRFDVIVLEEQLNGLSDEELTKLIQIIFKNSKVKDQAEEDNNDEEIQNQPEQYDELGNPITKENVQYDELGNPITNENIQYDELGNPITNENVQYDELGNPINNGNVQYDELGNPINNGNEENNNLAHNSNNENEKSKDKNIININYDKIDEQINNEIIEDKEIDEYVPSQELISIIIEKYKEINEENKKNNEPPINIYTLSQICRAIKIFDKKEINGVTPQNIVDFSLILILNKDLDFNNLKIPQKIYDYLIELPEEPDSDDNKFFYSESQSLCNFMAIIHASSLINLPLCISGDPGVGKTAMIRSFGRIRAEKANKYSKDKPSFQLHTFHNGTKPNDFFGMTTFKDKGEIVFTNGTLTTAMKYGYIFIADEMNVSPVQTMKSLSPALEPAFGESIYIPGIEQNIVIHNSFNFIACQNFLGTIGRNAIPDSIKSRLTIKISPSK